MTVICIGYFDKFSRFFLDIKKHLKSKSNTHVNFKINSIHLSGFLYTFFRFKFSNWIALKAWFKVLRKKRYYKTVIASSDTYKDIPYNNYIKFHKALNSNISVTTLQLQALAYIDIFEKQFKKEQPDYLLTLGDSRLCVEIAIAVAKKNSIKVYYIEQGPFNTTFFDDEGVNANLSIRRKYNSKVESKTTSEIENPNKVKQNKYSRSPFYRGMDFLFAMLFEKTFICPPDLKFTDVIHKGSKSLSVSSNNINTIKRPIVLLILQIPLDVNMIYHSPNYKTQTEILTSVYSSLPENAELIIREHPLFINKYESCFYEFIKKNNITIDNKTALNQALKLAKVVVVNNSTVGIEAIINYKTVVVLGNAFYDNKDICLKLENKDDLGLILEKAMHHEVNKVKIDTFKDELFSSVLLQGAITDETLESSKAIANHLIATY